MMLRAGWTLGLDGKMGYDSLPVHARYLKQVEGNEAFQFSECDNPLRPYLWITIDPPPMSVVGSASSAACI